MIDVTGSQHDRLAAHLHTLDDESASRADKMHASDALARGGKPAMALLIGRLRQPRDQLFLNDVVVDHGRMNAGPAVRTSVTVKWQCEALLYAMLESVPSSTEGPDLGAIAVAPLAYISDWVAFLDRVKDLSLDEIHAVARAEHDAVTRSLSTSQRMRPSATPSSINKDSP
jgi:hypothetical protein